MRHLRALVVIAVSCVSLACGSDSETDPSTSVVGTWNLTSANGSSLPFTVQAANPKIEVLDEHFVFTSGGTFAIMGNSRETTTAGVVSTKPFTDSGTWTLSGATVNVHFNGGSNNTLALSGNTLTLVDGTRTSYVFTKQ